MSKYRLAGCLAASALIVSMAGPATATSVSAPPQQRVTIDVVNVNGSGCPAGTAAVAVSPDNSAFTVTYSDYVAQTGAGVSAVESRKNCQLVLQVNVPSGFTYAIAEANYRGFASLEPGATGQIRANYYFQGESQTGTTTRLLNGALDDDWQVTDSTDVANLSFAPCGEERLFNVNTSLRVTGDGSNFLVMDSADGSVSTVYQIAWQQC